MKGRRCLCLALAVYMTALAGCGKQAQSTDPALSYTDPYAHLEGDHDGRSDAIYTDTLNDFYSAYQAAQQAQTVSQRHALMAVAEAKLLQSCVMLPLSASGGTYAISRLAPNTASTVLWGNDADRFHNAIVTTQPITADHRAAMRTAWAELKGTGTWESWARAYLADNGYTLKDSYTMS